MLYQWAAENLMGQGPRRAKSESLAFHSIWVNQAFFLCPTKVTKQITFLFINYLVTVLIHRPVGVHVPFWSPLPAFRGNYWVLSSGSIFVLKWNKSRAFPLTMNCVRKFNCFNDARCNLGKVETDTSPRFHQFVVGGLSEVFQGMALFFHSICFGIFLASFPSFRSIFRVSAHSTHELVGAVLTIA